MQALRLSRLSLLRGVAVGAVAMGSLATAATALAAPADAPVLDHQLTSHLGAGQVARFQFEYGGSGDVAEITLLPAVGPAQLGVRVLGPDQAPVQSYDSEQTSAAI